MSKKLSLSLEINADVKNVNDLTRLISELEKSGINVDKLKRQTKELDAAWGNLNPEEQSQRLRRLKESLLKTSDATDTAADSIDGLDSKFKKLGSRGDSTKRIRSGINKTNKSARKLKKTILALGTTITAVFATSVITRFFGAAIGGAAGLEEQLDKVQAVSGATNAEMKKIAASAKNLGATTKYTATQAAEGYEILARAGLNAKDSITTIPSVLNLATAAGIELADAASYITKTVAGMNLRVSESAHVADVLAKAAASANTDVAGLGQALSYAAPTAKSLGVSLEDTVAIIGKFADSGIDASRAGTALNSVMAQFSNPTSKFKQELTAIGITTNDFVQALAQLESAGASGANAINAVGLEAGPALKSLLAQGVASVNSLSASLKNAQGAAQNMSSTMSDNLIGATKGLGSAWDSLKNTIAKPLLEPVKGKVNELAAIIRDFVASGKIEAIGEAFAVTFKKIADSFISFIKNFDLTDTTQKVDDFTNNITSKFDKVGAAFGLVYNTIAAGFNVVEGVMFAVANAFSQAASVIVAGAAEVVDIIPGLDGTAEKMREVADGLQSVADAYGNELVESFNAADENISNIHKNTQTLVYGNNELTSSIQAVASAEEIASEKAQQASQLRQEQIATDIENLAQLRQSQAELISQKERNYQREAEIAADILTLSDKINEAIEGRTLATIESNKSIEQSNKSIATSTRKAAAESKKALDSLGVDVQKQMTGVSTAATTAMGNFATATRNSSASASKDMTVVQAAIDGVLKKLNSPQEFATFNEQLKATGKQSAATAEQLRAIEKGIKSTAAAAKSTTSSTEANTANATAVKESTSATKADTAAKEDNAAASDQVASASADIASEYLSVRNSFVGSEEAVKNFDESMSRSLQTFKPYVHYTQDLAKSAADAKQIYEQWTEETARSEQYMSHLNNRVAEGKVSMSAISSAARNAETNFSHLNDAQLDKLKSEIDSAKQKVISLEEQAKKTAQSISDELADATGNEEEKTNRKFQRRIEDIREKDAGTGRYGNAVGNLQKLRNIELKKIRKREAKKKQQEQERQAKEQSRQAQSQRGGSSQQIDPNHIIKKIDAYQPQQSIDTRQAAEQIAAAFTKKIRQSEKAAAEQAVKSIVQQINQFEKGRGR